MTQVIQKRPNKHMIKSHVLLNGTVQGYNTFEVLEGLLWLRLQMPTKTNENSFQWEAHERKKTELKLLFSLTLL